MVPQICFIFKFYHGRKSEIASSVELDRELVSA